MLLEQNASLMAEQAKQSQQLIHLQMLVQHVARELGLIHNHPHLATRMPDLYNPFTDEPTRPGPKDENPTRSLDPREIGWLHAQMTQMMTVSEDRCKGFKRIVAPRDWQQKREIDVCITDLDRRTQWKLWHYAFGDPSKTPLQVVLTEAEMEQSKPKKAGDEATTTRPPLNEESYRSLRNETIQLEAQQMMHQQRAAELQSRSPYDQGADAEVSALLVASPAASSG
jgi:hypothetical protein